MLASFGSMIEAKTLTIHTYKETQNISFMEDKEWMYVLYWIIKAEMETRVVCMNGGIGKVK